MGLKVNVSVAKAQIRIACYSAISLICRKKLTKFNHRNSSIKYVSQAVVYLVICSDYIGRPVIGICCC
jgi:hypothetical protein